MPPKQRFSPQDVIDAAYHVVRKQGWGGLAARSIATELNSSTRPIYDYFSSMEHIETEVVKKVLSTFVSFISQKRTGDIWLDQALGYVLFASKEKHLFRCINDEKHTPIQKQFTERHWVELGEDLTTDERFKNLSEGTKHKIRAARWVMIHGLACLVNIGWIDKTLTKESILSNANGLKLIDFLKKINHGLYEEFKTNDVP